MKAERGPAEKVFEDELAELRQWAEDNLRDARNDARAFWALKIPAVISSASVGVWVHFGWSAVGIVSGAIASVCVLVDGIQPRGALRNTHLRAVHEIRMLISEMTSEFRSSAEPPDELVRRLIRNSQAERHRIAAYIRDAETTLRTTDEGQSRRARLR